MAAKKVSKAKVVVAKPVVAKAVRTRTISKAGRQAISDAQTKRWAAYHKAAKRGVVAKTKVKAKSKSKAA